MIAVLVLSIAFIVVRAPSGAFFRFGYIIKPTTVWPGAPRGPEIQLISDLQYEYSILPAQGIFYDTESVRLAGTDKL